MSEPIFDTILITGAAGNLGTELRRGLAPLARRLRLNDREEIADLKDNEEAVICDLSDEAAVIAMCEGVDAIVHFGGAPVEKPWQEILDSSIRGSYHVYEGARKHGVRRVVYASSVHAIGFHTLESNIDARSPQRPDTLYGVSKCFVENLSSLYWDKFGIESVMVRIFSSFPEPADRRHLWSWLSFDDLNRLVTAALTAPRVGHTIVFGTSDNAIVPLDNRLAGHLGFHPQDNTEPYRAAVETRTPVPDPHDPTVARYGGAFVTYPHPDDDGTA
ncbi:NAD-dependent epimerase/dehydratase [Roseivivax marinus]|jgi:uronate dehydrogenase|uniref:NAD-dependent epimerase/dehydratase n=1 Tax=Roseivivax marinus TaxID=1379903 RepID=W4HNW4_9RHOB|nr:NAD(P)-dependent oxidoreductase [Roseivivax marinus]ETW14123.1 NAD-dependent epimerase/dehydratase [Roseivivax marinus]